MNELPTTFGKYFLSEKLATGGMAEIYLAKLIGPGGFEKRLIIKQILPQFSKQPEFVDLFVAEAKTLVSLTHGNIVPVYELGVVDGTYFIAMEYIDGPTLELFGEAMAAGPEPLEPSTAAFICAEFLKGLDYAHRKGDGVIHRDLSPRNVMISRDGEVKLVDFGIAVALDQQRDTTEHEPTGPPAGSYPYMSPEQVRRAPLTGRTDLFSAGVLLWEMLTNQRLFRRDTADATLQAVTDAEIVSPSTINPKVPPQLDVICMRALQRQEQDRFATAVEFLTAINRYLYSREAHETAAKLSKLVAKRCPPIVVSAAREERSESDPARDDGVDRTKPITRTKPVDRTKPIQRAKTPDGKARAKTATFATHIQFENVLAKATPLFPIQAIDDLEARLAAGDAGGVGAEVGAEAASQANPGPSARTIADTATSAGTGAPTIADTATNSGPGAPTIADTATSAGTGAPTIADTATSAGPGAPTIADTANSPGTGAPTIADTATSAGPGAPTIADTATNPGTGAPTIVDTQAPSPNAGTGVAAIETAAVERIAPSSDRLWRNIAIASVITSISVVVFFMTRPKPTVAPTTAQDASAIVLTRLDAGLPDAQRRVDARTRTDARTTPDARTKIDARAKIDARRRIVRRRPDAAVRPPRQFGKLRVGANPWGAVYLGTKKLGRTPNSWTVPVGKHTVVVKFPVPGREQTRRFNITIRKGQETSLGVVDFSKPPAKN